MNDTKLAIIVSTLSNKKLKITPKVYGLKKLFPHATQLYKYPFLDLGEDKVVDIELVEQWKDGLPQVYVIAYIPSRGIYWYAVSEESFVSLCLYLVLIGFNVWL